MKKNYIILILAMLFFGAVFAQETQKNFINYQGVARNASNGLMSGEAIEIGISLKFGSANGPAVYQESHSSTTDANGVFSLLIGNGSPISGNYNTLPWGNGAAFITLSMNGNEIGTTEMMAVPYAISSGDADDQSAAEVPYDNAVSGLAARNTQEAIDELVGSGVVDADADPTNELQTISFDVATNKISLSNGGEITIPTGGTDADADPENEFQTLNFDPATNELSLSDGNTVTIPSGGTDTDADPENEIDVTRRNGLLVGDDGIVDGLVGTADGQVAKWDAALGNWVAGTDNTGGAGSSLWTDNGGDIYFNSGRVGIGATDPTGALHILKDEGVPPFLILETTSGSTSDIRYRKAGVNQSWNQTATIESDEASSIMNITYYDGGTPHNIMTLRGNRRMGINNFNPQTELDVQGQIRSSDLSGGGNVIADVEGNLIIGAGGGGGSLWTEDRGDLSYSLGNVGIGIAVPRFLLDVKGRGETTLNLETSDDNNFIRFVNSDGYQGYAGIINGNRDMDFGTGSDNTVGKVHLVINSTPKLTVANDGNVGIGTMEPTTELDVEGNIRSSNLSGSGQRNVMADAEGKLVIGSSGVGGITTGFETLDEGSGLGWRLIGRDDANYGPIGLNALDASTNATPSTTRGATGFSSTALGEETTASGPRSTAMGYGARATGSVSLAVGEETEASGEFAVAIGDRTRATEQSSTAFGSGTSATNSHTTAMGESTVASGKSATSMGIGTKAEGLGSLAIGRNNIGGGDPFLWQPNDPLFEIGNGTDAVANNALTVLKNGKVGIGTDVPMATLEVEGSINSSDLSGSGIRNVLADADGNLVIGDGGADSSPWTVSGSSVYRTGGSIGIGTVPNTDYQLHLNGSMLYEGRFLKFDGGIQKQWTQYIDPVNGAIGFGSHMSDTESFFPRFKLARTGELELGTQSRKEAWVHIPNNSTLAKPHLKLEETENDYARLEFKNEATGFWHIAGRPDDNSANSKLNFYYNNGSEGRDRMTILGNGNVGIGGSSPTARFHIFQGGQEIEKGLRFSDGINQDWTVAHGFGLGFYYGGSLRAVINATNGAYIQASDARLKSNIKTLPSVLEKVKQLRPSTYFYISDEKQNTTIGLIAQQVQPLFPELVSSSGEERMLGIDYSTFSVVAIKAIQEQQTIIDKQSVLISALEKRLKRLETKIGQ